MKWYSSSMLLRDRSVGEAMAVVGAAGYDGIEVWIDHADEHAEGPDRLRQAAEAAGLGTTVHAPSYDLNLAAWNRSIRMESQRLTIGSLRFASELGASVVVVHPGRRSSSRDRIEDHWPIVLASLEPIDDAARQMGLTIGLELMERRSKEVVMLPEDARRVMEHGYRATGITLDLAHAWSHYDPVRFLGELDMAWVVHVHLSDSDPKTVHLPLGEGEVDLARMYQALVATGYDGVVNIEGFAEARGTDLIEANRRAIDRLTAGSGVAIDAG